MKVTVYSANIPKWLVSSVIAQIRRVYSFPLKRFASVWSFFVVEGFDGEIVTTFWH